jgi:hypothetical protein
LEAIRAQWSEVLENPKTLTTQTAQELAGALNVFFAEGQRVRSAPTTVTGLTALTYPASRLTDKHSGSAPPQVAPEHQKGTFT